MRRKASQLKRMRTQVEAAAALPIDLILLYFRNEGLRPRAKRLGIPVHLVSSFSE
jgi:hypothetical protein